RGGPSSMERHQAVLAVMIDQMFPDRQTTHDRRVHKPPILSQRDSRKAPSSLAALLPDSRLEQKGRTSGRGAFIEGVNTPFHSGLVFGTRQGIGWSWLCSSMSRSSSPSPVLILQPAVPLTPE